MKVFIMRHGEAEHFANTDAERALTKRGKKLSLAVAQAAAEQGVTHFDKVLVSPYLRAQETWLEISEVFSGNKVETSEDITPYGVSDQVFDYTIAMAEVEKPRECVVCVALAIGRVFNGRVCHWYDATYVPNVGIGLYRF